MYLCTGVINFWIQPSFSFCYKFSNCKHGKKWGEESTKILIYREQKELLKNC